MATISWRVSAASPVSRLAERCRASAVLVG
jgi:hypothetical protein